MRLITKIALWFYTIVILFFVVFTAGISLHLITLDQVTWLSETIYFDPQLRVIVALTGLLVFLMNILFNQAISGKEFQETNIAFDNPTGRVTVTLSALEDLIRRVLSRLEDVKDVRHVRIRAGKKGLDVRVNLALNSDVVIPEITAGIQDVVRKKVVDTLGMEESIMVRIDVTKIALDEKYPHAGEKSSKSSRDEIPSTVPFQGYRA